VFVTLHPMRVPLGLATATLVASLSSPAAADLVVAGGSSRSSSLSSSSRPSSSSASSRTEFYGWINILVGELGVGSAIGIAALSSLSAGGGGRDAGEVAALGGAVYLFGGPVVHTVKDDFPKALGAFGLLVGLPVTGALIGYGASSGCSADDCRGEAAVWGGVTGAVLAPLVDGLALGWKSERSERASAPAVMPFAMPVAGGATAGIAGAF
jgi:hypothetical protein